MFKDRFLIYANVLLKNDGFSLNLVQNQVKVASIALLVSLTVVIDSDVL